MQFSRADFLQVLIFIEYYVIVMSPDGLFKQQFIHVKVNTICKQVLIDFKLNNHFDVNYEHVFKTVKCIFFSFQNQ